MNTTLNHSTGQVPNWRQHLLRVVFVLNFIGLAFDNWSTVLYPGEQLDPWSGVAISFYAAFSLLCLLGIRFPLKFLPLLMIQLIYKSAWMVSTYLPAYQLNQMDESLSSWFWVMVPGIIIDLLVIPWGFVYREYLKYFFRKEAQSFG
ncbi:MAG: hypothetical protein R8G66_04295 [Cytophagales bacterium]|nr:hypothetical protein [Cytophagales bacterium]